MNRIVRNRVKVNGYKYSDDRLYILWNGMIGRCYREKNRNYKNYGGRGIGMCKEWKEDFFAFKRWAITSGYNYDLDRKYQALDRIDNDGDYCPENCRWVSQSDNNKNRRSVPRGPYSRHSRHKPHNVNGVLWSINGVEKPMAQWCDEYGITYQLAQYRIKKAGMTPLEALTSPKKHTNGRKKKTSVS